MPLENYIASYAKKATTKLAQWDSRLAVILFLMQPKKICFQKHKMTAFGSVLQYILLSLFVRAVSITDHAEDFLANTAGANNNGATRSPWNFMPTAYNVLSL